MARKATTGTYKPHPMPAYRNNIRLVQGRRKNYPELWEAQFAEPGGKWGQPFSLKTDDEMQAAFAAVEEHTRRKQGIVPQPRTPQHTFREAAGKTLQRLQVQHDALLTAEGREKAHNIAVLMGRIRNVLMPQLGDQPVKEITEETLDAWLLTYRVNGKAKNGIPHEPAKSTIGNLAMAYRQVMLDARAAGWITKDEVVSIDQSQHDKGERNPTFTRDEMIKVRDYMTDAWIDAGHTEEKRQDRYLLRAQIALMCCTGLRAGLEIERITPGQIDFFEKDSNNRPAIRIHIRRKQGKHPQQRDAWITKEDVWDAETLLRKLIIWLGDKTTPEAEANNSDQWIFARPLDGHIPEYAVTFRCLLKELDLRIDPETGKPRVPYSCRHYYATQSLLRGMTPAQLVALMGTTLRMIDEHYGHIIARMQSGDATGSGRVAKRRLAELSKAIQEGQATEEHPETV